MAEKSRHLEFYAAFWIFRIKINLHAFRIIDTPERVEGAKFLRKGYSVKTMNRMNMIMASVRQAGSTRISVGNTPDNMRLDSMGVAAMREGTKSRIDRNNAARNRSMRAATKPVRR